MKLGYIEKPHGTRGCLKFITTKLLDDKISELKVIHLSDSKGKKIPVEIWGIRKYKPGQYIIRLNGFKTREEVERFSSRTVAI